MNKVALRFKIVKENKVIEVLFDKRLSFSENFKLLNEIYDLGDTESICIYDQNYKKALRKDVKIELFNFPNFTNLYIY